MTSPADLAAVVAAKVETLRAELLDKVDANLSGDALQTRSGALKSSIVGSVATDGDTITAEIGATGVPYARIQEEGGVTPPHEIVPVKALALAFAGAGGTRFARRVQHPGSVIPPHRYLGGALDALRGEIVGGLKASVAQALGAD